MKILVVFLSLLCLSACSALDQLDEIKLPILVEQYPLPPVPEVMLGPQTQIDYELLVAKDGSVMDARLIKSSGDAEWDSSALKTMRLWKYSPATFKGEPIKLWLRQTAIIRLVEPECICLAEIVCNTSAEADSAYSLLIDGMEFTEVVKKFSISKTKENDGALGYINVMKYPKQIRKMLDKLAPNEYTKPIEYNGQFVIFKKLKH